jgi:uncharacterized protein YuzB (UPF0349 family)
MSNNADNNKVEIKKAASKKQAIQLLTSDFVCVNEPIRFIFVEADNDKKIYEIIQKNLIDSQFIASEYQLVFKSHGRIKKDSFSIDKNDNNVKSKDVLEDSSRGEVERLVQKCVDGEDQDKTLEDFMFGLVDGDNRGESTLTNIKTLYTYAIENYIYDPIHVFFSLKQKKSQEKLFILAQDRINYLLKSDNLTLPESLFDILNIQFSNIKNKILQTILDVVFDIFYKELKSDKNNSDREFRKIINRFSHDRFKLIDIQGNIFDERIKVYFIGNIDLNYPSLLFKMRGHDIEYIYNKFFSKSLSMRLMINFCISNMIIPLDLAETLMAFQKPSVNFKKNQQAIINTPLSKPKENNEEIEKLKEKYVQDIKNKDKKIENQLKKINELENIRIPKFRKEKENLQADLNESEKKLETVRKSWSTQNSLPQFLKSRGIFNKKHKAFEFEDIHSVIDLKDTSLIAAHKKVKESIQNNFPSSLISSLTEVVRINNVSKNIEGMDITKKSSSKK